METKLDRLLASIDPKRTQTSTGKAVDRAINTFPMPGGRVESWPEFRDCVSGFVCHVENTVLQLCPPREVHPTMDFGRACRYLMKEFGPEGDQAGANMAIHGVEGGLYRVLKAVGQRMADEYDGNEVKARIGAYWKRLTVDERLDASKEYLSKYGHLLPEDVTEGSAARLRAYFPKFLEQHPQLIRKLRNVGR
jgi:hypothetical protein